jgi:hypothetical protein
MYDGKMVFSQIMELVPWRRFQTCVDRYQGDKKIKTLSCREFFLVMVFAQITGRESLSSIVLCTKVLASHCYHIGIQSKITKSHLAHANNQRNWKIFFDFAQILIRETTKLYCYDPVKLDINEGVYALDSTTIDLCLTFAGTPDKQYFLGHIFAKPVLPFWGKRLRCTRRLTCEVKSLPATELQKTILILISTGKMHDVHAMDPIDWEPGCWYVMDRG